MAFKKIKKFYNNNRIAFQTIVGVFFGLLCGLLIRRIFLEHHKDSFDPYLLRYLSLPGILYIRVFLILIVPLLLTSLSTSMLTHHNVLNHDNFDSKKAVFFTIIFFVCTSLFSATVGISAVRLLQPGVGYENSFSQVSYTAETNRQNDINERILRKMDSIKKHNQQIDSIFNIIMNIIPGNILAPTFSTSYQTTKVNWPLNSSEILNENFVPSLRIESSDSFKTNMMGVCMISLVLGIVLQKMDPEKSSTIRKMLFECGEVVNNAMLYLVRFMPFGMFCWMFTEALKMHSIGSVASQLIYFLSIALACFSFHLFIFYPLVYFCFVRENPYKIYSKIFPAIMVAFGTTSSAITLPMTIQCMEKDDFLPKNISKLVLGLGMTIHMNGSAMYYPMVAVFVSQLRGLHVDLTSLFVLGVFAVLMSMGFPGSPAGGAVIVNHIAFATVLGIDNPQDVLAFIIAFEWMMERVRTSVNIIGDCFVSKCVQARFAKKNVDN